MGKRTDLLCQCLINRVLLNHSSLREKIADMKRSGFFLTFYFISPLLILLLPSLLFGGDPAYTYRLPNQRYGNDIRAITVIGSPRTYIIQKDDTLLDIARDFNLGFSEIRSLHATLDPWVPPEGAELMIPIFWILPEGEWNGILINIPEMRL